MVGKCSSDTCKYNNHSHEEQHNQQDHDRYSFESDIWIIGGIFNIILQSKTKKDMSTVHNNEVKDTSSMSDNMI